MKKPTPAELRAFAKEQGWAEDFGGVNPFTGKPRFSDEQIQKWIDQFWLSTGEEPYCTEPDCCCKPLE